MYLFIYLNICHLSNFIYITSPQTSKSNSDKRIWSLVRLPIGQHILTPAWLSMVPLDWSNFDIQYLIPQTTKSNSDKSMWLLVSLPIGQHILTPDWCRASAEWSREYRQSAIQIPASTSVFFMHRQLLHRGAISCYVEGPAVLQCAAVNHNWTLNSNAL